VEALSWFFGLPVPGEVITSSENQQPLKSYANVRDGKREDNGVVKKGVPKGS